MDKRKLKSDSFSSTEELHRPKRRRNRDENSENESNEDSSSSKEDTETVKIKEEDEENDGYNEEEEFEAIKTINEIKDIIKFNRNIDNDLIDRLRSLMDGKYADELDEEYYTMIQEKIIEFRNSDEPMQAEEEQEPVQVDLSCVKQEK